jgi:hypothetical protein
VSRAFQLQLDILQLKWAERHPDIADRIREVDATVPPTPEAGPAADDARQFRSGIGAADASAKSNAQLLVENRRAIGPAVVSNLMQSFSGGSGGGVVAGNKAPVEGRSGYKGLVPARPAIGGGR